MKRHSRFSRKGGASAGQGFAPRFRPRRQRSAPSARPLATSVSGTDGATTLCRVAVADELRLRAVSDAHPPVLRSYAPMSFLRPRLSPRWSRFGAVLRLALLIAVLRLRRAIVRVGPP